MCPKVWLSVCTTIALALGCSGKVDLGGDAGGGGGGDGGGPGAEGGGSIACPLSQPAAMAACSPLGLVCGYGNDPRLQCRPTATCAAGGWTILDPTVGNSQCSTLPSTTCPATIAVAQGQACTPMNAYCIYGDLSCQCTNCIPGPSEQCVGAPVWQCETPNSNASCPPGEPNLGTPCSTEGLNCAYTCDIKSGNGGRLCSGGIWVSGMGQNCPISSRRYKRGIEYLADGDREALAVELERIRLATYEYKSPALAGKRHLGFIIEDNPDIPAVDVSRTQIDLYGYASMIVAASQVQAKRIDELEREVASLRAELREDRTAASPVCGGSGSLAPQGTALGSALPARGTHR
jgi:hypothetical protein